MRARPALIRLLALLLLLQWGSAFAHCLPATPASAALHVEICTPEGIRLAILPGDAPEDPEHGMGFCPACGGPAALALPAVAVALAPPLVLAQSTEPNPAPGPGPAPMPSCRPPPRAPPTS